MHGITRSLKDWYAANGIYELLIGASSRDIRLKTQIQMTGSQPLPLHLHLNTTLGELLADERTKEYGVRLINKMTQFFGGSSSDEAASSAISDEMNNAMALSMPLRNLASFGLCSKEEIQQTLDELKRIQ